MKRQWLAAFVLAAALLAGCSGADKPGEEYADARRIVLAGHSATLDGAAVPEYDYVWHCDPTVSHGEVKNAPAEYHTGTAPSGDDAVFIDSDLPYYPSLPQADFAQVPYDGETEWAYYYRDGEHEDFIFATLPVLGRAFPAGMMHTEEEAAENRVLHITEPGTYVLTGEWRGQILVDLGDQEECFADESKKVTLVLDGAEIVCTVAPGLIFYSAFECDNGWEERASYSADVDTADAGAVLVLADGSVNSVKGTNVFRMLKTKYKDTASDGVPVQKKQRKTDAALYSYVTLNVRGGAAGSGALTVESGFEGLDSELHLNLMGGQICILSQDDGINVNEDDVSVAIFSGASVTVRAGLGAEGDGVDSNGFIRLDGGTLDVSGIRVPDSALDSEKGIFYYGGSVILDGVTQTYEPGSSFREIGGSGGGPGGPGGPGGFGDHDGPSGPGGPGGPGGPSGPEGPGGPDGPGGWNGELPPEPPEGLEGEGPPAPPEG